MISSITAGVWSDAIALDEKDRGFIVRAGHFLQGGEEDEQSRAFAVFDDADDVKIVVEKP